MTCAFLTTILHMHDNFPCMQSAGGRDPTNIGTLRDSVAFNQVEEDEKRRMEQATPKARGLVKDTVDPRLRKSVAR